MKLQTITPLQQADNPLDYESKSLLLGSCFAENIGDKLDYFKFQSLQNPFGILFHPLAIENLLERAISGKLYAENEVFEQGGVWSCFEVHSKLNALSLKEILYALNEALERTASFLKEATYVFITLGTAWVYQHQSREFPVANCHKVPPKEFEKRLLSPKVLIKSIENSIDLLQSIGPKKQIVFTVSPVRHLKDGFVENQRSKANLINAIHTVLSLKIESCGYYFPSYEIMMDELRDYRFYEKDMVHPNELAIHYIWERFKSVWISKETHQIMDKVDAVQKGLAHKPFNPESASHKAFEKDLQAKIEYLQKRYPTLNFDR